ncbi:MAG: signal peptidase I [Spirochaetes bacterium]|nr:signal peptidase I [Spirochaetota bacterium]
MFINDDKTYGLTKYAKLLIVFAGLIIGFIISRVFFIVPFTAQDNSMNPNIAKGDYLLILKITSPEEGDTVLVKSPVEPGRVILKRLIARGEKIIEIKNKKTFINNIEFIPKWNLQSIDKRVFPEYFNHRDNLPQIKILKSEIFVMGDNFDYSFDSRNFGAIDEGQIIGKMIYKF